MTDPQTVKTAAQLKNDIDRGRTDDKIAWPDPAAVPLGADEEAAGTPPSAAAVAQAHADETSRQVGSRRRQAGAEIFLTLGVGVAICAILLLVLIAL
jgi:hypothetical protein